MNTITKPISQSSDAYSTVIEEIDQFPVDREVIHCGQTSHISPFAIYATCPVCQAKIKVRSFAAVTELEDVFEAVFRWMNRPGAADHAQEHLQLLAEDAE